MTRKNWFFLGIILASSGFMPPALALGAGIVFGLSFEHPYHAESQHLSRLLLQASVVALGFGMPLAEVLRVGRSGFLFTALSIGSAIVLGLLLGHWMKVERSSAYLITVGTAVCGGSAIAAVAPITGADDDQMAVSLGTVFLLNAAALFVFPLIGHAAGLNEQQFGLWAALAIHDTSSVVGAAARYGGVALAIATTVKLTRALWIVPVSAVTAVAQKSRARVRWPWFIALFCAAALANTLLPAWRGAFGEVSRLGRVGLTATLFLIGTGITRRSLRAVGVRPLALGLTLWIAVSVVSLTLIRAGWVRL